MSIKLCLTRRSWDGFEARLEHGVELEKNFAMFRADGVPFTIFERTNGDAEFAFQSFVGMKEAATVATHDLELAIDGFDEIGGTEGPAHVFGIVQESQVVGSLLTEFMDPAGIFIGKVVA